MSRFLLSIAIALFAGAFAAADIPAGYYNQLDGKKDEALKTAAYNIIHNFTLRADYSVVYKNLPQDFQKTDIYPESRRWWDMYSDIPLYAPSFAGLNREHSFPKSWWGGSTTVNAYVDLNHLYPAEANANMKKSNYPLGEVDPNSNPYFRNGLSTVGYPVAGQGGNAKYVFEPDNEYKGDFARTYFYMVTCYQTYSWVNNYSYMLQNNTYPTLKPWAVDLLLKWSREDPVSEKEIERNEEVYKLQNNRNPFIDFPQLAEYIWGNRMGEAFDLSAQGGGTVTGDPVLITPVQDMSLDFGQVAKGKQSVAKLFFNGENLTGTLSVRIYSGDSKYFTIPSNKIAASLVNSADGYWLNITYSPDEVGVHTSRLLVSDGGMDGSLGISLIGECMDVPTLHACTATAATDITAESYVANWTCPDDVVDYYIVTRTRYTGNEVKEEEVLAETNSVQMDEFDQSDRESYYVRSSLLGYYSDPSNVIFVEHSGITGVESDMPMQVLGLTGAIRIVCSAPHTGCRIYDAMGRLAMVVDEVSNNTDIEMPLGVYMVVTDQCRTPKKVIIR